MIAKAKRIWPGAMASLLLFAAHARADEAPPPPAPAPQKTPHKPVRPALRRQAARRGAARRAIEVGTASWYGPGVAGRRMADGRRFDAQSMVAAHPWLPLGARVRVALVGSDRFVDVTITDRAPNRARVIDLSEGAARQLGILHRGTAEVVITPL